jgi:hypothetical protein
MAARSVSTPGGRVEIENVNHPGIVSKVDARMYAGMRAAVLAVVPAGAPGLTQTEMRSAVLPHLPEDLYPGGAKADWWSKAVQLDLEAKGLIVREKGTPLRWHRAPGRDSMSTGDEHAGEERH